MKAVTRKAKGKEMVTISLPYCVDKRIVRAVEEALGCREKRAIKEIRKALLNKVLDALGCSLLAIPPGEYHVDAISADDLELYPDYSVIDEEGKVLSWNDDL